MGYDIPCVVVLVCYCEGYPCHMPSQELFLCLMQNVQCSFPLCALCPLGNKFDNTCDYIELHYGPKIWFIFIKKHVEK